VDLLARVALDRQRLRERESAIEKMVAEKPVGFAVS
jgi:hypothetical protein